MSKIIAFFLCVSMHLGVYATNNPSRDDVMRIVGKKTHEIFGQRRGNFLVPNGLVADALVAPFGIPEPTGVTEISENIFLVSGCRPHSCDEKAIGIVDMASGKMLASGLRHFHCRRESVPNSSATRNIQTTCDSSPTISVFLYRYKTEKRHVLSEDQLIENVRTWATNVGGGEEHVERVFSTR